MGKIGMTRREFIKGLAAGTAALGTLGITGAFADEAVSEAAAAGKLFVPGTYISTQNTDFATVEVTCDITETGVGKVSYKVIKTSDSDYFAKMAGAFDDYCARIGAAGSAVEVDGVSGATMSTFAIKNGVNECLAQALGINIAALKAGSSAVAVNPQDYDYVKAPSGDLSSSALFTPWKIGPYTIESRFAKSAAFTMVFMKDNPDEYVNYYKQMAAGGTKMIWVENFANTWDTNPSPMKKQLGEYDVKRLLDELHACGATVGTQLDNMGSPLGPMVLTTEPFIGQYSTEDVHGWQQNIIRIAGEIKDAGFDAFEINMAANNLGQSFFSRARNNRTDEYGPQSIESRTKFATEIIKGIKEKCGKDFALQILINGVEECDFDLGNNEQYNTIEETIAIAKKLEEAGADSLHIRLGPAGQHISQFAGDLYFTARGLEGYNGYGTRVDFSKHFQGLANGNRSGLGLNLEIAAKIKAAVSIPVGCATFNDPALNPDYFISAIEEGKVDYFMINRPLYADPDYVNKLREGRIDEIAPCTRCLHCFFDAPLDGGCTEHCRVNATRWRAYGPTMPEGFEPAPAETKKNVVVVGGGPGGMEAARIAASRGHKVTLLEKEDTLGTMLAFADAVKGPHENLGRLRSYLIGQCNLTGVTVKTGVEADTAAILAENPDAVVLAVGGKRPASVLSSTSGVKAMPVDDVLGGDLGDSIVVYGSNCQAVDTAIYLHYLGKDVTIVTPYAAADFEKGHSVNVKEFVTPALRAAGVRTFSGVTDAEVTETGLRFTAMSGVSQEIPCATVIEALDAEKNTDLAEGLGDIPVFTVGDCDQPFNIANAIYTGNLAGRAI